MKNLLTVLFCLLMASCGVETLSQKVKAQTLEDFNCINQQADNAPSLADANTWLPGTWQLTGMQTMLPTTEVENITLTISDLGKNRFKVMVKKGNAELFTSETTLKDESFEKNTYLTLKAESTTASSDNYNFIYGNLRICKNEMMIDNGMAFDAPAYLFKRK